jgi:hypothetical protein
LVAAGAKERERELQANQRLMFGKRCHVRAAEARPRTGYIKGVSRRELSKREILANDR